MLNMAVVELQRDLLLEQLYEVEEKLSDNGMKKSKKGFTTFLLNGSYYVRYIDAITGKQLSKRNLYTTDKEEADILAKKYQASILKSYFDKKSKIKDIITFFGDYYKLEKSPYLKEVIKKKQRVISDRIIKKYDRFIHNYFLVFLKENEITRFNQITLERLTDFQSFLSDKNLSPKTINDNINGAIKQIFTNLLVKGVIKDTPFVRDNKYFKFNLAKSGTSKRLRIKNIDKTLAVLMDKEIWKLYKTKESIEKGKFVNKINYKKYRLMCLLSATCGLRNAEIFMLRVENKILIRRTYFLDIVNSRIGEEGLKTESSERKVPIPTITLQALEEYIEENKITDYLFYKGSKTIHGNTFFFAKNQFGAHCGYSEEDLKKLNFEFYSFRHFYKTFLTGSEIKETIIKYFMGHAVDPQDMGDNYTHIEDLDEWFFETYGLKIIKYIDKQCRKVEEKYDLLPIHTHIEQVSLKNNKSKVITYFANVLNDINFENETYLFIGDLQDKQLLPNTDNRNELKAGLEILLKKKIISKRRFEDCVHFIQRLRY